MAVPRNREIDFGFVFVFVSCRASGRGEAVWVRDTRASLPLGLGVRICPAPRGQFWAHWYAQVRGFFAFLVVFVRVAVLILGDFVHRCVGFLLLPKCLKHNFVRRCVGFGLPQGVFGLLLCTGVWVF